MIHAEFMNKLPPLLQLTNLSRTTFGPVSLDIEAGDCLGIYGPSGAGKSQLLRAIAELDPSDGDIALDGIASHAIAPSEWRKQVGLLPPESCWWYATPHEHFVNGMPIPLEHIGFTHTILDRPVTRLSSGEKQRLALLRLLANKPRVLLLDEPTANLDPENVQRVERVIEAYRREHEAAVLWVSHDRQQIKRVATRLFECSQGKIQEHEMASQ